MLDDMRDIFGSVCADFEAELAEMDGEDDHVHLLVNDPPKVAVSALVNSLKGVSSRLMRQRHPAWCGGIGRACCGPRPISPHLAAERPSASSANTSNSSKRLPRASSF
jgi:REP element-mobilizing transposase RayT